MLEHGDCCWAFVLALSLVEDSAKQALADTTPVTSEAELSWLLLLRSADGSQTIVQVNTDFTMLSVLRFQLIRTLG